jgi:hypothetical protein
VADARGLVEAARVAGRLASAPERGA